jgi:hypothetical protein
MSEAGAVINIIGSQHRPGEFLQQIIFFIAAFGRA